ncbi:MAG: hypothetical protein FD123_1235 [Bacteroidetes bacterium]|nr:MAG: hypothetical protein FD123_1235 [Bacteroidota bacterium]
MKRFALPLLVAISAFAVTCKPDFDEIRPSPGTADFSRTIAVGDNFLSGYQDGAFSADGQQHSVPALLNRQFMLAGGNEFTQALLPADASAGWYGKPWESWYVTASQLGDRTDCEGVVSMGPVKQFLPLANAQQVLAPQNVPGLGDFAVPFLTTDQWFNPAAGSNPFSTNQPPFYHRIASQPGVSTFAGDVRAGNATFFTAWAGMENIYAYARNGATGPPPVPAAVFADHLDSLLAPLTAAGAKGVIANLPGFRSFPYYTLIPWDGADLTQNKADSLNDIYEVSGLTHIVFEAGDNGFVIDDTTAPYDVRQLHAGEYITLTVPLDSMKCHYMGILFSTIPDRYVLDSGEVAFIDATIAAYNQVIAQKAAQYGLAFADMHNYFEQVTAGVVWDGVTHDATFVSGGFYSLDGYHPHQKGYALIANEFIKAINLKFGATIPTLNCFDCVGVKFP